MSEICERLHHLFQPLPVLSFPFDSGRLPQNGIYVLYEAGEFAHGTDRIVRIGTHTGDKQLPSRIKQHFLKENKDRSIFRKNIGRAILNRDNDSFLTQWQLDLTTRQAKVQYAHLIDFDKQQAIEKQVSAYIQQHLRFIVFRVDDKQERLELESKLISTVSLCTECHPSAAWLGHHSPVEKIRRSGLWLVNELYRTPLAEDDFARLNGILFPR